MNQYGQINPINPMNPYMGMNNQRSQFIPQQQQNGITWVQGIEGAKAFQIAPSSNTVMLDSENDGIFYIKVSDNVGMCTLRIFKFTEITEQQPAKLNPDEYVKKSELEEILNKMLGGKSNEQSVQSTKPAKSKITE